MRIRGKIVGIPVDRQTGERKGFMFIRGDDNVERFGHRSGLQKTTGSFEDLQVGDTVEFWPVDDAPKGPRALEIIVVK